MPHTAGAFSVLSPRTIVSCKSFHLLNADCVPGNGSSFVPNQNFLNILIFLSGILVKLSKKNQKFTNRTSGSFSMGLRLFPSPAFAEPMPIFSHDAENRGNHYTRSYVSKLLKHFLSGRFNGSVRKETQDLICRFFHLALR